MQLFIPGVHCESPPRGIWAKGYGLPAETGDCSLTCDQGMKAEGSPEPTREMRSSLQSCIQSLGFTALLFYFLQLSVALFHFNLFPQPCCCSPTHAW